MDDIYYIDLTKTGKDYVGSRDVSVLINTQAVVESLLNIISTEPGERVMNPDFGCYLNRYLFSPIDILTSIDMQIAIEDAIYNYEPRIEEFHVIITPDEENNTYTINIFFSTKVLGRQEQLNFQLNKIR